MFHKCLTKRYAIVLQSVSRVFHECFTQTIILQFSTLFVTLFVTLFSTLFSTLFVAFANEIYLKTLAREERNFTLAGICPTP